MRVGGGGNVQQLQGAGGGGGCPSCKGQASECCKKGLGCAKSGDGDGLKKIMDMLRQFMQQDPQGVKSALNENPQFVQALQQGGINAGQ